MSVAPYRSFDPRRVGSLETNAWLSYYRRDWLALLRAAVGLTRDTFALPWPQTLYGAWLVLRANQQWAPAANDPAAARQTMARFYGLLRRRYAAALDPAVAAGLEVQWWRVHRDHQHGPPGADEAPLVDALAALYAYVYEVAPEAVRPAAQQRARAMGLCDRWVAEGRAPDSPLIAEVRAALIRAYAALLSAVHVV